MMLFKKKLNLILKDLPIQMVLLLLIIVAMAEFVSVSFIIMNLLKKLNISPENENIQLFISKIAFINISMILLFGLIVLLVSRIFKKINNYAFYSCTTGLPNKNYMMNNLINEISQDKEFAALISLDMDDFKAVNDTLGHLAGDELLKLAGERFEHAIGEQDCVCHIGGDEFLFFIKSARDQAQTELIAKRILGLFADPFYVNGSKVDYVSASLGIALMPEHGTNFQTLYNCSDDAMYMSKKLGKSSYTFYDKNMSMNLYEETIKKKEIKDGIRQKEFKAYYQAKYSQNGQLTGAEALARWVRADGTVVPPSEFIVFAEKNGLIVAITDLILEEVCKDILSWIDKGERDFIISINITSQHITSRKLILNLIEQIELLHVPAEYLEFEITESMVIEDFQKAVENIALLKSYGLKVSMDDFGTGYSSLNYLKTLPIDIIKIDKSFIDSVSYNEKDKILLENIIHLAHGFQLKVIAEGIEYEDQLNILKDMECDMFQGFLLGKPVHKEEFEQVFLNKDHTISIGEKL
ncbi:bifunctional diguanylate cyclase/phosphodiesterase [Clostridium boliviensis]|uniref:Bifunctional diguanylate cyclase/phosphodiesterase n=1 Tax=Clostridium boliviensis TaxID=318465 RepID=A0ABU4GQZ4_9CLOT|nr:bifunctional diguanylate cyclase/phosphodiesterase [Clostridium boliviensis]MDW2800046.1 bifunctional diguanylate cyclase/phosphodiesterase [Clostridium boliviensis]